MKGFASGVAVGVLGGIILGVYLGRFSAAVQSTAIGFGAGVGIFFMGAVLKIVAGLADRAFSRFKEGKQA